VYASEARLKPGQTLQAKSMEEFVRLGQILFPLEQRVETWATLEDLLLAIDVGTCQRAVRRQSCAEICLTLSNGLGNLSVSAAPNSSATRPISKSDAAPVQLDRAVV
jgi:hypothetical protein